MAQMPPNGAEAMLAKPCATSSQLDRCRRPVMPSATTADSSDSIAPSSAKAMASGSTSTILSMPANALAARIYAAVHQYAYVNHVPAMLPSGEIARGKAIMLACRVVVFWREIDGNPISSTASEG